jgi:hypothetical protein
MSLTEPMVVVDAFGALHSNNAQGLDPGFLADPSVRMNAARVRADRVSKTICLWMPQGALVNNTYCVTCSGVVPASVTSWVANEAPKFKAAGWKLIIYTGSRMPRVGGTGAAEQNATSQLAGAEAGSIPFGTGDITWILDNCINTFAASFHAVVFDAYGSTVGEQNTLDAVRAAVRSRGWFPGGVGSEPIPVTYGGSPRPNSINTALAVRGPAITAWSSFYVSRDYFLGNPSPQVLTYRVPPGATHHIWIDAQFCGFSVQKGCEILETLKRNGFIISVFGGMEDVAPWFMDWWRKNYGTSVRRGRV